MPGEINLGARMQYLVECGRSTDEQLLQEFHGILTASEKSTLTAEQRWRIDILGVEMAHRDALRNTDIEIHF